MKLSLEQRNVPESFRPRKHLEDEKERERVARRQKNENMEHYEVNKVITIKRSYSQSVGPEGNVFWSNDSQLLQEELWKTDTHPLIKVKWGLAC